MATARVRHVPDKRALAILLNSPSGGVAKDIFRRCKKVEARAKQNLQRAPRRIDTGHLRSDIHSELLTIGGHPVGRVGFNAFYGIFVHDGTGVYGPKGTPITPKQAKMLSWKNKLGKRVYAKQVLGMRPNPFLKDAVSAAKD